MIRLGLKGVCSLYEILPQILPVSVQRCDRAGCGNDIISSDMGSLLFCFLSLPTLWLPLSSAGARGSRGAEGKLRKNISTKLIYPTSKKTEKSGLLQPNFARSCTINSPTDWGILGWVGMGEGGVGHPGQANRQKWEWETTWGEQKAPGAKSSDTGLRVPGGGWCREQM